jgi:CubicO group peptidase (beta-lactamase class C family)
MIKKLNISVLLILASLVFTGCKVNDSKQRGFSVEAEQIDSLFKDQYQKGRFNGSVLVVKGDSTIYEASFGYSDGSKTKPLDKNFRFNMGSVYKEFPAVAIMQLVESGHLKMQDKVQKFIPELPEWSRQITVEHLLKYTSGLPVVNWTKHVSISESDVMADLMALESLLFTPGKDYLYTNNSPFLLIKIVERIAKMSFEDYAIQHLFAPLGMNQTLFKSSYPFKDRKLMAIPFGANGQEDSFPIAMGSILICSTPTDMFKWLDGLHSQRLISNESLIELTQKSSANRANVQAPLGYAKVTDSIITEHSHHGSSGNYEALISRYNDLDLTVVLLTNQKHGNLQLLTQKVKGIIAETK